MAALDVAVRLLATDMSGGGFSSFAYNAQMVTRAVFQLGNQMSSVSPLFAEAGAAALASGALFAAFAVPVSAGVGAAADLQYALVNLQIATESNSDALPILTQAINDLAINTVYGSKEASDAFALLAEKGFTVSQVLYGMGANADEYKQHAYDAAEATNGLGYQALVLGQAMKTSADDGANLLAAALNAFKDQGLSAKDAANLLAGAFFNGIPDAQQLQEAISMAGAQADMAGVSFHDFLTTLDLAAQSGLNTSAAASGLNYMIRAMISPTNKAEKEMAALGIATANAGPALYDLTSKMENAGGAAAKAADDYNNSVTGLQDLFTAAQKAGLIPLDETFNQWAEKTGVLSNKLFDAQGNFIGLQGAVDVFKAALDPLPMQQKIDAIGQIFNIRSGRLAQVLFNIQDFDTKYEATWTRIGNMDVTKAAQEALDTFNGAIQAFKDSVLSALAVAFMPLLQAITPLITQVNNLVQGFMGLPAPVRTAVAIFLVFGLLAAAVGVVVGVVVAGIGLLAAAAVPLAPILAAVGIAAGAVVGAGLTAAGVFLLLSRFGNQLGDAIRGVWDWLAHYLGPILGFLLGPLVAIGQGIWDMAQLVGRVLGPVLKDVGDIFASWGPLFSQTLQPALNQLGQAWNELQKTFQDLKPGLDLVLIAFRTIGEVVGGVLLIVLGLLLGIIVGLVNAFVNLVAGVAMFIVGALQVIIGFIQFFAALVGTVWSVIVAIFSGHTDQIGQILQTGFGHMGEALKNILQGLWTMVLGLLQATFGTIIGFVTGLVGTVVSWFEHLFDILVGHSIVPDLIMAIIGWFVKLPLMVIGALAHFVLTVASAFLTLLQNVPGWVGTMMEQIITGIVSHIPLVGGAVQGVAQVISNFLGHHSPPPMGPLSDDDQWMPNMMNQFQSGIQNGTPGVTGAVGGMSTDVTSLLNGMQDNGCMAFGGLTSCAQQHADKLLQAVTSRMQKTKQSAVDHMDQMADQSTAAASRMSDGVTKHAGRMQDQLVGHSIIPDMVNSILAWMSRMADGAEQAASAMASRVASKLGQLKDQAFSWGRDLMQNLINGINSMLGSLGGAIGNVASKIASVLHHTTPEEGPLKDDDRWMVDFMDNLAGGMNSRMYVVRSAAENVARTIQAGVNPGLSNQQAQGQYTVMQAANGGSGNGQLQPITIYLDPHTKLAEYVFDQATGKLQQAGLNRFGRG